MAGSSAMSTIDEKKTKSVTFLFFRAMFVPYASGGSGRAMVPCSLSAL
jgi:hypothetical protein